MRRWGLLLALAAGFSASAPAHARMMELQFPADCALGEDCFIQHYVDHDPAKGVFKDYTCGSLGYDGHTGTDIRVEHLARLHGEGVNILAAAAGEVNRVQSAVTVEEGDLPLLQIIKLGVMRQPCGEGIRIDHGKGWDSQYCHLKSGSITVKEGDKVAAGQVIGKMGVTGKTQFPHLHFELRHYGKVIDPFVGHSTAYNCEAERRYPLWADASADRLSYVPAGVLASGFTTGEPNLRDIRRGVALPLTSLSGDAMLGAWADVYGLQQGDDILLRLAAANGEILAEQRLTQEKPAIVRLFTLTAQPENPQGQFTATLEVQRREQAVLNHKWQVVVE